MIQKAISGILLTINSLCFVRAKMFMILLALKGGIKLILFRMPNGLN